MSFREEMKKVLDKAIDDKLLTVLNRNKAGYIKAYEIKDNKITLIIDQLRKIKVISEMATGKNEIVSVEKPNDYYSIIVASDWDYIEFFESEESKNE